MRNNFFFRAFSILSICSVMLVPFSASAKSGKSNIDIDLIKALYQKHQYSIALQDLRIYKSLHPHDPDAYFFAGLIYYKQENYAAAQENFAKVLELLPNYAEAREFMFNSAMNDKNYDKAIEIANEGIERAKNSEEWQYKKAKALYEKRDYYQTIMILRPLRKTHPKADALYKLINHSTRYRYLPHFEAGLGSSTMSVNIPEQVWALDGVYAAYVNKNGRLGFNVNQAQRLGFQAFQYGVFAWPKITDYLYLHLAYSYSDNAALFANNDDIAEAYFTLPQGVDFSGGTEYRKIAHTNLTSYFMGIGKYFYDDYYFSFSPIVFRPRAGSDSVLYRFSLRRYYGNHEEYFGLSFGTGQSPDLADLLTVSFFVTDYSYVLLEAQTPIDDKLLLNYGIGYSWQKFPQGYVRQMLILNLGVNFKFV